MNLLCLCPLLLGLLLATQPQWEPALPAAPAGSPGQGPAIKRPIKALSSSRTPSRVIWMSMDLPQLHSSTTMSQAINAMSRVLRKLWRKIHNLPSHLIQLPNPKIAAEQDKGHSEQCHDCAYHAGPAHVLGADNSWKARWILSICSCFSDNICGSNGRR